MKRHDIALYLTFEFTQHFHLRTIRAISSDIKISPCLQTGVPVFSTGRYHGPKSESGLLLIDQQSIHLRLNEDLKSRLFDEHVQDAEEHMLKDLYRQIYEQLDGLEAHFDSTEMRFIANTHQSQISKLAEITQPDSEGKVNVH